MMKPEELAIGEHLARVGKRWLYLHAALWSAVLLSVFALCFLVLGYAVWVGWISEMWTALRWNLGALLVWLLGTGVMWLRAWLGFRERRWCAAASEAIEPLLKDRLNTITYLEEQHPKSTGRVFLDKIRKQTLGVLQSSRRMPFSSARMLWTWCVALCLLSVSLWFHLRYEPWKRFRVAPGLVAKEAPETSFELASEGEKKPASRTSSGEVRITDPGRDLKLTKVDVLEMKIEAASNEPLKEVGWRHSVNGGTPAVHGLSAPREPNYAAYTEALYLDELKLSDWDVVSYFAEASAEKVGGVRSEIYFIEIRPFRSEILQLPGGEKGKANQMLREVSGLITRQQQVLRETQRFLSREEKNVTVREQERGKLEAAELELKRSTDSLYAEVAAKMEHQDIAAVLDGLATGAESMERARNALREDVVLVGQEKELLALQQLVSTRKTLQKAISESPEAFDEEKQKTEKEPMEALAEVSEIRNRRNSGKEELRRLEKEQKELRTQSKAAAAASRGESDKRMQELKKTVQGLPKDHPDVAEYDKLSADKLREWSQKRDVLAQQQSELGERLAGMTRQWPELFHGVGEEENATRQAMNEAAEGLKKNDKIQHWQNRVMDRLQDLQKAIQGHDPARNMEEAERLNQLITAEAAALERGTNGEKSETQIAQTAAAAQAATRELREIAESGKSGMGPELAAALTGEKRAELERALGRLSAGGQAPKEQELKEAARGLKDISKAFEEARPKAAAKGNADDRNQPEDALSRAMIQMRSLLQRSQDGRQAEPSADAQQREEALENLKIGFSKYGTGAGKLEVWMEVERALATRDRPLDVEALNKLMDSVERFRLELSEKRQREELRDEMNHSDPAKISPLYRDRVQEYFRRLSEQ